MFKRVASLVALCVFASGVLLVWQPPASAQDAGGCITYLPSPDSDPGSAVIAGDGSVFGYTTSWRSASNTGKLVTMAPDGSQYTVVAEHWVDPVSGLSYDVSIGAPSFSTDGSVMVAQWIPRGTFDAVSDAESGTALFSGGPAGFGEPDIIPDLFGPQISRDGSTIVFWPFRGSISVMDVASRNIEATFETTDTEEYWFPKISADGQTVAFSRQLSQEFVYSSTYELVSYDIDLGVERVIATQSSFISLYGLSANGDRVAYSTSYDEYYVDDAGTQIPMTVMADIINQPIPPDAFYGIELVSHVFSADGKTWFFAEEDGYGDTTALKAVDVDTNTVGNTLDFNELLVSRFIDITVSDDQSLMIFSNYRPLTPDAPETGKTLYIWDLQSCTVPGEVEGDVLGVGIGVGDDALVVPTDLFDPDFPYSPGEELFCLANVSEPAPSYAVVCWYDGASRDDYIGEIPLGGLDDKVIWLGESDIATGTIPTPVQP